MKEPVSFSPYQNEVFRVFSTAHPSQELLNDLLEDPAEIELLKPLYYSEKEPASMDRLERILQRSANEIIQKEISSKFEPENWYVSRFSDGTWGVLYSAETAETAQAESIYHKRNFYHEELKKEPVTFDLCQAVLSVKSDHMVDLTKDKNLDQSKLTSQTTSGYPYCQKIAKNLIAQSTQLIRTSSARHPTGICTPIFDRSVILKDTGPINYIKVVFYQEETEIFSPANH